MAIFSLFDDVKHTVRTQTLEPDSITTIYGDVLLDLTQAPLAAGDHTLRLGTFCGEITLRVSDQIGVALEGSTVYSEIKIEPRATGDQEHVGPIWISEHFDRADVRLRVKVWSVLGGIEIVRVPSEAAGPYRLLPHADTTEPLAGTTTAYEGATIRLR